jgi:hypothetical protein
MEDEKVMDRDLSGLEAQVNNDEDNELGLTTDELRKHDNMDLLKQKLPDGYLPDRFETDVPLRAKFRNPKDSLQGGLRVKPTDTMMDKNTKTKKGSAQSC